MHTVSLYEWRDSADSAQRAYLAQSAAVHELLTGPGLPGWPSLDDMRAIHADLAADWPTATWPALCGPRGADVSRFVPSLNELRMAPQDLNIYAYSHELAHALAPQHNHKPAWAVQQFEVLMNIVRLVDSAEVLRATEVLRYHYHLLEVI